MSSRNHNTAPVESSPVNHRRSLNASQVMDAIGRIDDETGQPVDPEKSKVTPPASPARLASSHTPSNTFEIGTRVDVGKPIEGLIPPMEIEDEEDNDVDDDLERLLASCDIETARTKRQNGPAWSSCCGCTGPGDTTILFPRIFARSGWGMLGPHPFGPIFVMLLILWASHYFIKLSFQIGPITTAICVFATVWTMFTLCDVSFRDPGIVTDQTPPVSVDISRWRWCDVCNTYQPPDGQHCPDCNVCIEGYDHHCVWMGTCIGKKNYRQFIRFNLSWLLYLIFAISWVYVLGPAMYNKH
jgi:palmitoyltransferase